MRKVAKWIKSWQWPQEITDNIEKLLDQGVNLTIRPSRHAVKGDLGAEDDDDERKDDGMCGKWNWKKNGVW